MPDAEDRTTYSRALIVGAGAGLSASLARRFTLGGLAISLAARNTDKLRDLCQETGARAFRCDAAEPRAVADLFEKLDKADSTPDVVVYNASGRVRGAIETLDPNSVRDALLASAQGGFNVAREAAIRMQKAGHGAILFTGASASVKGYPRSAPFAMGKFALRGLSQSLARELQPHNIHVAHIAIDGAIAAAGRPTPPEKPDSLLSPDAIAETYWHLLKQHRSAWASEIELRPWVETF